MGSDMFGEEQPFSETEPIDLASDIGLEAEGASEL